MEHNKTVHKIGQIGWRELNGTNSPMIRVFFLSLPSSSDWVTFLPEIMGIIQVPQHLTHMSTFLLVYTHTQMDIVLSLAKLNKYVMSLLLTLCRLSSLCLPQLYNCTIQLEASLC